MIGGALPRSGYTEQPRALALGLRCRVSALKVASEMDVELGFEALFRGLDAIGYIQYAGPQNQASVATVTAIFTRRITQG